MRYYTPDDYERGSRNHEIVDSRSTAGSISARSSIYDAAARFARASFSVRLGLRCYYQLSGRFVMTPEAAILVLSAAYYRQGMTAVRFIFPPSLFPTSFQREHVLIHLLAEN